MNQPQGNWTAISALLLGIINLGITLYLVLRDKAKLVTGSVFSPYVPLAFGVEGSWSNAQIIVTAVNNGRRPIVIITLGVNYNDGTSDEVRLEDVGITLSEKQMGEWSLSDLLCLGFVNADGNRFAKNAWFKDTSGKKYKIKNAKKNIQKYVEDLKQSNPNPQ